MPEVTETKLICDRKTCREPGARVRIDNGRRTVEVILCDTHIVPLNNLVLLGRSVSDAPTVRQSRGLNRSRLDGIPVVEDD